MVNSNVVNKRIRLETDARREDLLKLGKKLFGKYSYDELSINEIAEKASISKGLLYHYFSTKKEFYIATVRAGADELLRNIGRNMDASKVLRFSLGVDEYLEYVETNSAAYLSLLKSGVGVDPEVVKIVEEVRKKIMQLFWDAMGIEQPTGLQKISLRGWIGFVEGASQDWLESKSITREELKKLMMRQLVFAFSGTGLLKGIAKSVISKLKLLTLADEII